MGYSTKNYTEQGGDKTIISGELAVTAEGKVTFDGTEFKPAVFQADSTATEIAEIVTDFNALLVKLKTAGLMESE